MEIVNCKHWTAGGKDGGRCALTEKTVSFGFCGYCHKSGKGCELVDAAKPLQVTIEGVALTTTATTAVSPRVRDGTRSGAKKGCGCGRK